MIALEVKDYCQNCAEFDQKCNRLYEFIKKENDKEI